MKAITANAVSQNGKMNTESNHHNGEGRGAQQTFPLCDLCIIHWQCSPVRLMPPGGAKSAISIAPEIEPIRYLPLRPLFASGGACMS